MNRIKAFLASPLGKVAQEGLRWGVLAFVSVVVEFGLQQLPGLEQTPDVKLVYLGLLLADKLLHKSGVAEKGLTRF